MFNAGQNEKFQECIDACFACGVECTRCANELMNEDKIHSLSKSIKLHQDCTSLCFLAMEAMSSGSDYIKQITRICAEISYDCSADCKKNTRIGSCDLCTVVCHQCGDACTKVSQMADK